MKNNTPGIILAVILFSTTGSILLFNSKCDPIYGTARKGTIEYLLNPYKNRTSVPDKIDPSITLEKILMKGNDSCRFRNSDRALVQGYVTLVKLAGPESCNCDKSDSSNRDIHIEIAATPNEIDKSKLLIVEISPKIRAENSWTLDTFKSLTGHLVRFSGWMMFDVIHADVSANTSKGAIIERATAWEVHPVMSFQIVK